MGGPEVAEEELPQEEAPVEEPPAEELPVDDGMGEPEVAEEELPQEEAPVEEPPAAELPVDDDLPNSHEEAVEIELLEQGVADHLKDAVEGSLRLKRLLTADDKEAGAVAKKRKVGINDTSTGNEHEATVKQMVMKWGLVNDVVVRHVLNSLPFDELKALQATNFVPDQWNQWKSASELLAKYVVELRERKMVSGGPLDVISAFKRRWELDAAQEKVLRSLPHKRLRYVMKEYQGIMTFEEIVTQSEDAEYTEEDPLTETAVPDSLGGSTIGRFYRLELVDPTADSAVFGDANLTFALKLTKHRSALGHVGRELATTFEDLDTLRQRYKEIDQSIKTLEEHHCEVYHGVDCTRIALDPRFEGMESTLGAVYYNFPHSGAIQGFFDGHPMVNWRHENLMRLFFRALRSFMKPNGVVKVASNMGAVGVRYSYIVGAALENEFAHVATVPFLEWHLHRYGRSYGDKRDVYKRPDAQNNQSYNAQRAEADMVYCFRYQPTGEILPNQQIRLPPTLSTLMGCTDGPFKGMIGPAKQRLATQLHERFVKEVTGTHVG